MNIYNNTPQTAAYNVNYGDAAECGTIPPQQTISNSNWDNQKSLTVILSSYGGDPPTDGNPFLVTVPQTGTGMVVTIGCYQE